MRTLTDELIERMQRDKAIDCEKRAQLMPCRNHHPRSRSMYLGNYSCNQYVTPGTCSTCFAVKIDNV